MNATNLFSSDCSVPGHGAQSDSKTNPPNTVFIQVSPQWWQRGWQGRTAGFYIEIVSISFARNPSKSNLISMKTMNKYLWSAKLSGHLPSGPDYISSLVLTETNECYPGLDADGHRGFCLRS